MTRFLSGLFVGLGIAVAAQVSAQDATTTLTLLVRDLQASFLGVSQPISVIRLTGTASAPSSATSGTLYLDSTPTADELCVYDGAAWQALSSGTDANCA